ncbi:MAG TPA: hypothetical protein VG841_08200 [Caulobacterales bacterium]|nr:hypothetical protein [Caulobacterales bacterium]
MAEVKPERVLLTSRLLDDLGIDGDDAVELFDDINKRFGTDFASLYERWGGYFGPEGMPLSAELVIILAMVIGGVVAYAVTGPFGDVAGSIVGITAVSALIAVSIWIKRKLGLGKKITPITVAEVVRAVEAGAWPAESQRD